MDFLIASPTLEEAMASSEDSTERAVGFKCSGCSYVSWAAVRDAVRTDVKCFRADCEETTTLEFSSNSFR